MKTLQTTVLFLAAAVLFLSACGEGSQEKSIIISGTVDLTQVEDELQGPVMLAIMRADDIESSEGFVNLDIAKIIENPGASVVEYFSIDVQNPAFFVDVTESGLRPGDDVIVFAFAANNYTDGIIAPKQGDFVGIAVHDDLDRLPLVHKVKNGINALDIKIDREFVDMTSRLTGRIETVETSTPIDVYVFAYLTEDKLTTIDFSNGGLAIDGVVGYFQKKNVNTFQHNFLEYNLEIIPYLPYKYYDKKAEEIDNISVFGWLDMNQNGTVDEEDFVGYYVHPDEIFTLSSSQDEVLIPASLMIKNRRNASKIDIQNLKKLSNLVSESGEDSGQAVETAALDPIMLKGNVTLPDIASDTPDSHIYIIVADADYATTMKEKPLDGLYYFNRVPAGRTDFEFEIANSNLRAGDEVMIVGLWDRDNNGWFPAPTRGDVLGAYIDMQHFRSTYRLKPGDNRGIQIDLTREVFDFDLNISGKMNIDISDYSAATATIVAYAGELTSLDISKLNPHAIVGMATVKSGQNSSDSYTMTIFPYGYDLPIDNVCIYAMLDEDNDGRPDKIGYHHNAVGFQGDPNGRWPRILTMETFGKLDDIDITFFDYPLRMKAVPPQKDAKPAVINCRFDLPQGPDLEESPIYAIVFDLSKDGIDELFSSNNMLENIKYLERIPSGLDTFTIDENAGIYSGDEIMIALFWDRDYNFSYPMPTTGDMCGYYYDLNNAAMLTVKLENQGTLNDGTMEYYFSPSASEHFALNRMYFEHQAILNFKINEVSGYVAPDDSITIFALQGDLSDFINFQIGHGFSIDWDNFDMDRIVAYDRTQMFSRSSATPNEYKLKLLPFLNPEIVQTSIDRGSFEQIENVFLFVVKENPDTENGIPDSGEFIGYYYRAFNPESGMENSFFPRRKIPSAINIPNTTVNLPGAVFIPRRKPLEIR